MVSLTLVLYFSATVPVTVFAVDAVLAILVTACCVGKVSVAMCIIFRCMLGCCSVIYIYMLLLCIYYVCVIRCTLGVRDLSGQCEERKDLCVCRQVWFLLVDYYWMHELSL